MTSRSNSFRGSGIPGGITPENTSTPSSPIPHISTVLTVNGKGRPSGLSNSPWGSKFRDRRDFFERISCTDEEEFSTGDEDEPRPLYDGSSSQIGYTIEPTLQQSFPSVSSPSRTSTTTTMSLSRSRRGIEKSTPRFMIDETGQKEGVPQESQSSQSQSDEGELSQPLSQVDVEHSRSSSLKRDTLLSDLEQEEKESKYLEDKGSSNKRNSAHYYNERTMHKEPVRRLSERKEYRSKDTNSSSLTSSSDDPNLLEHIDSLLQEKLRLNASFQEIIEKNQSLQRELNIQRKSSVKLLEKSNDMKKDIEVLSNENSHLTKSLNDVEKERDDLDLQKKEIQSQFEDCEKKLAQVDKFYQEAEQQNQTLEEELSSVLKSRDKLREEKNKLDIEVQEARRTKENYRSTIKKLREQNKTLEDRLSNLMCDKTSLLKDNEAKTAHERELTLKLSEAELKLSELEAEYSSVNEKLLKFEKEKSTLTTKLRGVESSTSLLREQLNEFKQEKEQLAQKLVTLGKKERLLSDQHQLILKEIDKSVKEVQMKCPLLKIQESHSSMRKTRGSQSPDLPSEIMAMKALHNIVMSEVASLQEHTRLLEQKKSLLESQIIEQDKSLKEKDEINDQLKDELLALEKEKKRELGILQKKYEELEKISARERAIQKKEITEQKKAKVALENSVKELTGSYETMLKYREEVEKDLRDKETSLIQAVGHLLAEKACIKAQLFVSSPLPLTTASVHKQDTQVTTDTDFDESSDQMTNQIETLTEERDSLQHDLNNLTQRYQETFSLLQQSQEERRNWNLETDKLKVQLMTEISLLKSQVSGLEKDKAMLELQVSESTPSGTGSAFQPVPRKVTFDSTTQDMNPQEMLELQHKVSILEAENKRLQDLLHNSSSTMEAGNALRRQILEMRKKTYFLEAEKKQLTETVSKLRLSLKTMRESKDRMTQDRLHTLQEENSSLQDRIRGMEDMFTRKLVDADAKIAATAKENDQLQYKLSFIPESLKAIEQFKHTLVLLETQVHTQEENLAGLKANLTGSGGSLNPVGEILERVLKKHDDIQTLLSTRSSEEVSGRAAGLGRSASSGYASLPPVLQQFSPEYISSLQGNSSTTSGTGRARSNSQSQAVNPISTNFVFQIREKVSQLHADNLSITDLVKHVQDNLSSRYSEVARLQESLLTFERELKQCLKTLDESHDNLTLLWQREMPLEQLNSIVILERQVENWQDKVYARDMALRDIDAQMKEDYEKHNRRFSLLKSQVLELKEEVAMNSGALLTKDQYMHELEERSLNAESELFKLKKQMEQAIQEALNVPDGFQLQSHGGNLAEFIRLQNEEVHQLKTVLNEYIFQTNQLQSKVESVHRENALLQRQTLEMERHHQQIRDELHTERDYLRRLNLQLIEQQLKAEEAGDLLKMLKRSQESIREQREIRKMASELEATKLAILEKDMHISELQHQLDTQQLDALKGLHPPPSSTGTGEGRMAGYQHKSYSHLSRFSRPHSASSAESARPSRYMIADPNHPKARNRNNLPFMVEGDFLIHLPSSTNGDTCSILNLSEQSDPRTGNGPYIGYSVVTDDEGGANLTEADDTTSKQPQKNRIRRHRRTHSAGSDSLKNLSSGSSASDSRPPISLNQSSTLPLSVTRQHKAPKRPGSADSMRFELHSPVNEPAGHDDNSIIQYAKDVVEGIGEMMSQHEDIEVEQKPPEDNLPPVGKEKGGNDKSSKGESSSTKSGIWSHLGLRLGKGSSKQFSGKGSSKAKEKDAEKMVNKGNDSIETNSSDNTHAFSKQLTEPSDSFLFTPDRAQTQLLHKTDEANVNTENLSAQLSRIPSLNSSVGRSDSFASTASTTFSGVGGESSPYSTLSLDSLLIDSMDNLIRSPFGLLSSQGTLQRGPFHTPIIPPNYLHTSSSDEDGRSYAGSGGNRTLKRGNAVEKGAKTLPHLFRPLNTAIHHRANSSCDSDQFQAHGPSSSYSDVTIPLHRNESISISDMDKELTDHEDVQDRIQTLQKQMGKVRRSSTGSIIICNNSGSSMEDIKAAD